MGSYKPKILILITKAEVGGAQNFVLGLSRGLKKAGFELVVGCGQTGYLTQNLNKNNIPFIILKNLKRSHNLLTALKFIQEIKTYLNKHSFDFLILNSSNTLPASLGGRQAKNKPKTIFIFHGLSLLDKNYRAPFALKLLYRIYFKMFLPFVDQKIFVCHHNLKTALEQNLVKDGLIIHNGIAEIKKEMLDRQTARKILLNKISVQPQNKKYQPRKNQFLIGSVGRLAYPKNYEFLINAFPQLLKIRPDACLIIIGQGKKRKKYETLIKKLNLGQKIFLAGEIKNAYRLLKAFDLFILPSEFEGLSLTLIEALTAKIPILATRVGGNAEILANDDNQLYELNNLKDFLKKFKTLAIDKDKRQQAAKHNLEQSRKFSQEKMIKKYIDLIEAIHRRQTAVGKARH